jgi:hypothetical protein
MLLRRLFSVEISLLSQSLGEKSPRGLTLLLARVGCEATGSTCLTHCAGLFWTRDFGIHF